MDDVKIEKNSIWKKRLLIFVITWLAISIAMCLKIPVKTIGDFLALVFYLSLGPAIWFGGLIIKIIEELSTAKRWFFIFLLILSGFIIWSLIYTIDNNGCSGRCLARNVEIKSNIENLRIEAEMWKDSNPGGNGTYESFCASQNFQRISERIKSQSQKDIKCFSSKKEWCVEADLIVKGEFCSDSTGYAGPEANCSADHIFCQ